MPRRGQNRGDQFPPTGTESQLKLHQDPQEGKFNVDPGFDVSKMPPTW